jgi:hypothetical protein
VAESVPTVRRISPATPSSFEESPPEHSRPISSRKGLANALPVRNSSSTLGRLFANRSPWRLVSASHIPRSRSRRTGTESRTLRLNSKGRACCLESAPERNGRSPAKGRVRFVERSSRSVTAPRIVGAGARGSLNPRASKRLRRLLREVTLALLPGDGTPSWPRLEPRHPPLSCSSMVSQLAIPDRAESDAPVGCRSETFDTIDRD